MKGVFRNTKRTGVVMLNHQYYKNGIALSGPSSFSAVFDKSCGRAEATTRTVRSTWTAAGGGCRGFRHGAWDLHVQGQNPINPLIHSGAKNPPVSINLGLVWVRFPTWLHGFDILSQFFSM